MQTQLSCNLFFLVCIFAYPYFTWIFLCGIRCCSKGCSKSNNFKKHFLFSKCNLDLMQTLIKNLYFAWHLDSLEILNELFHKHFVQLFRMDHEDLRNGKANFSQYLQFKRSTISHPRAESVSSSGFESNLSRFISVSVSRAEI